MAGMAPASLAALDEARRCMEEIGALREQMRGACRRRDDWIVSAHYEAGIAPTAIARAVGMSVSHVRNAIDRAQRRARKDDTRG